MIDVNKLRTKKLWNEEFKSKYQYIKDNIGRTKCLEEKVIVKLSDAIIEIDLAGYLTNLIIWKPGLLKFNYTISLDSVFECDNVNAGDIKRYVDNYYVRPLRMKINSQLLNVEMIKIIEGYKAINEDFGLILCCTYNLYQIIQLMRKSPEFADLINTKIPKGLQPQEIEKYCKVRLNRMMKILEESDTGFSPLIKTGQINPGQLQELLMVVGNKSDLDGTIYPEPINTNVMIGGLDTPAHLYLDACSARKALIMNKKYTGKSGYFSRKLNLLTLDIVMSKTTHNCGTQEYIKYHVDDEESLKRIEGKYYKMRKSGPFLRTVKYNSYELIGKTILMRSPIKCKCKDGICHTCYGELAKLNESINIGMLGSTIISSQFTQNILSAKHLSKTDAIKISMSKKFDDFFTLDENQIFYDNADSKYDKYYIMMDSSDLTAEVDDYYEDEDDDSGNKELNIVDELFCDKILIVDSNRNVIASIREKNDMRMNISEYMNELITRYTRNNKYVLIPLSDLENDEPLFYIDVANNELTKTLNLVKDLIEKEDHLGCTNIDDMVYKFNRLLIDGRINSQLVHAEIILRNLARSSKNLTKRPKYSKCGDDYKILTVKRALMYHPAEFVSLSFEKVNDQLRRVLTFRKHNSSMLDRLFMESYSQTYDIKKSEIKEMREVI